MNEILGNIEGCRCLAFVLSVPALLGIRCLLMFIENKDVRYVLSLLLLLPMFGLQVCLLAEFFDIRNMTGLCIIMLLVCLEYYKINLFLTKKIVELIDCTIARTREK